MHTGSRTAALAILLPALSACGTVQLGQDFDRTAFSSRVERGSTTQAQVQQWLGSPTGTGTYVDTAGKQFEEWTYYRGEGQLPALNDARFKFLQVRFDTQGIVQGYSWSE